MPSKKRWKCSVNCKESRENPKEPCPHLEKYLPKLTKRLAVYNEANIEQYPNPEPEEAPNEYTFQNRLKEYGLDKREVALVMAKVWDKYSWSMIVHRLNYLTEYQARRAWDDILDKLRKRGFNG